MGSLQEPRKEEEKPHENYSCYRLQNYANAQNSATASLTRDLYGVVREACAQQNVKWPVECQVVEDKIKHLEDWPPFPEYYYEQTGTELRPQPVGDEMGRIVYQYYPTSAVNYFSRSCVGGNKYLNDDVRPPLENENDTTLQFESRFECGNLGKAVQVSECYYELHLRADMYTSRHTQWFYFAVSNTRKDITYRFSVVNLTKGDSLYNHGMRPLMYSKREADLHGVGWRRFATNIVYFKNHDSSDTTIYDSDDDGEDDAPSYTLTFNVTFPHDYDTVYVAHCYPYSYSDLQEHLLSIQNDNFRSTVCRQRVLCRSLAGNPVYLLTITGNDNDDDAKKKRAVVLTGRVHPGETPSSWIMKGILDFLTADNPKAHDLRSQFIFKVIPMINPDGVIVGNHRCSLVGRDLNRQYKMVVKEMFPAIWHTKAMVRRLIDEYGVVMYGDFHAHSRKHNIFIYGCENRRNQDNHLREQIFPLLLHYNGGDKFSFRSCKFKVHRCKEGTARVVVWMMGVLHSYTMEASFGGASEGPRAGTHYNIHDFLSMGTQFCETLFEYFDPQPIKEKLRNKLWSRLIKKGSSADEPASIDFSETNSSSNESDRPTGTPIRVRKKKVIRNTRRKTPSRTSVAQVVEKVTSQMRLDKSERRSRSLHSRSGSCSSPITERSIRASENTEDTHNTHKNNPHPHPHPHTNSHPPRPRRKPLERSSTQTSASSEHRSLRPTQYKLEDALPLPCSAPPLRRSSHSLIRPNIQRDSQPPSPTPSDKLSDTFYRLRNQNTTPSPHSHSDSGDGEGRDYSESDTRSYMERMGELMSTRLAISDTEENVTSWWEREYGDRLLPPQPTIRRLEALEPVIAKTRLHDPRRHIRQNARPSRSQNPSIRLKSHLHRSLTRREKQEHPFHRKNKEYEKLLYLHDNKNKTRDYKTSHLYDTSYLEDYDLLYRKPEIDSEHLNNNLHHQYSSQHLNNNLYHQYSSQPSNLDMGTIDDLDKQINDIAITLTVPPATKSDASRFYAAQKNDDPQLLRAQKYEAQKYEDTHSKAQKSDEGRKSKAQNRNEPRSSKNENCDEARISKLSEAQKSNEPQFITSQKSEPQFLKAQKSNETQFLTAQKSNESQFLTAQKSNETQFLTSQKSEEAQISPKTSIENGNQKSIAKIEEFERRNSTRRKVIAKNVCDVDTDQLCADIATCDTLFLDTVAKETPELLAARNLKGKLKKKKSNSSSGGKNEAIEKLSKEGSEISISSSPNRNESEFSQAPPSDQKVKKKIKIVIGKKTKKVVKKVDKDT